ncbi:hypothetical protein AVJ23_00630 [Pseudoponticoccus marisrubri]|uniref:Uncharacterized protein n=1 Tax=Pseudoponticoccus marisrubri TaxID=1685382 RepID=A0A0W7WNU0_9RHOB|nr:hypothetical protein AVJ23_00630 [Pseudoponticoccus marisrubri]
MDVAAWPALREVGLSFQKALHFYLGAETSISEAFKGFRDDRCHGLIRHEKLAVAGDALVTVSDRWMENVISVLHAGGHLLDDLTAVLFALKLALGREDRLNKLSFGCIFKLKIQTLNRCAARCQFIAQLPIELRIARKPLQVIKYNDIGLAFLRFEIGKHGAHAGALHVVAAAAVIVREDHLDSKPTLFRILTAAMLLALKPVAVRLLLLVRDAAIDERVARHIALFYFIFHDSSLSSRVATQPRTH